jgi:ankyrin repeat protein
MMTNREKELFNAIDQHNVDAVSSLLSDGVSPNCIMDSYPYLNPLESAIYEVDMGGSIKMVEVLIENGADVNYCKEDDLITPLHLAVYIFDSDIVRLLLEKGANPNCIDTTGYTPLLYASEHHMNEIINLLLPHCNIDIINYFGSFRGMSALAFAVESLDVLTVEALLKSGADPNLHDADGKSIYEYLPQFEESDQQIWIQVSDMLNSER